MGAPDSGMQAAEQGTADSLLTALRTIKADERARHAGVLDYWLSIRGNKEFPPLHDLDPLELSDAGPSSILLELISGGQDAEVRHLGEELKGEVAVDRIIDAPNPSILACIAKKLPIVAISRDFLAFEDSYDGPDGWTRCWVTLLPLSSCGSWVDYVYAFVSVENSGAKPAQPEEPASAEEVAAEPVAEAPEAVVEEAEETVEPEVAFEESVEPVQAVEEPEPEEPEAPRGKTGPGFAKLIEGFANLTGFYGQSVNIDPSVPIEGEAEQPAVEPEAFEPPALEPGPIEAEAEQPEQPAPADEPVAIEQPPEEAAVEAVEEVPADVAPEEPAPAIEPEPDPDPEPAAQSAPALEGSLQSKLTDVRALADEARQAALRATAALHEGLSAAYDFALDAETSPEEYLRLVEAQGMKIQLRAPMAPVVKLAFDGLADPATIAQLEAVLAWALKEELPRGALGARIEEAGGIVELLNGTSRPS